MICRPCLHLRLVVLPRPASFSIWGCALKKLRFGMDSDCEKSMPKNCKEKKID